MPSPFHGVYISSTALRAFQRAMEVSGHNIANMNTRGYSRQTVEFTTNEPAAYYSGKLHMLGTGTNISSIARARDIFSDFRMYNALGDLGKSDVLAGNLKNIEGVFNEPGSEGIADGLDKFFNAWSGLASNPNDSTAKWQVRAAASTLVSRLSETYGRLEEFKDNAKLQVQGTITAINDMAQRIHELNGQIRAIGASGANPGDIQDQRDLLIQDLSKLVNVSTTPHDDGSVSVYVSNLPLVEQAHYRPFPTTFDATTQSVTDGVSTYPIRGGELLGNMKIIQHTDAAMSSLDSLANQLRTQINALHQTGVDANANTGVDFFDPTSTGARDIQLSAAITADANDIMSGTTGNAGDGALALQIAGLRTASVAALGNRGFSTYYQNLISSVASDVAYYADAVNAAGAIVNQVEDQIASVSGVSIDDEMANMVQFQRSYQAAARVLSILDQTTEDLINMVR